MTSNVKMILDEVNARIKLAEAKTAEDPSNFDSFPGAENDKAAPSEAKKPDPEVKDEGPASRTEATGAEPGSDVPLQQDHLYEADEPVLTPEKKPAETADANAKTASANPDVEKVAADILGIIRGSIQKKAKCGGKCEGKCNKEEKDSSCGKCGTCGKKAVSKCASEQENDVSRNISLETKILDKLASVRMAKQAGAEDAMNLIKAAEEYNRGANDAKMLIQKLAQAMEQDPAAGAEEAAGAADAEAAIADAAAADAQGADGTEDPVTPEEVVEAVSELVQEGQISQEDAAAIVSQMGADTTGEGDVSEDQIAEGIAQAIESGEITEDEAQQLVQELVGAGADPSVQDQIPEAPADAAGAAEEAGAADAEAAIADAAAADAAQGEQKTASARLMNKVASAMQKRAEDEQIARYQYGFIQKCAEYGCDPQKVAQYIQARQSGAL